MFSALLIAAAGLVLAWPVIADKLKAAIDAGLLAKIDRRHVVAGILAIAGILSYFRQPAADVPTPAPLPPDAKLVLKGKFVGPDASKDAITTACLLDEVAAELEYDANLPEPFLRTGQAMDQLRQRARLLLCRGVSLGDKHPLARDAIKDYLDEHAGVAGGPLSPAQRAAWISAYREVARAAEDASR